MDKAQRDAALEHATQIKRLVHDPSSFLTELHTQQQQYYSIQWLSHYGILDQVLTSSGSASYHEVATAAKVPESVLRSMARMAMTAGFLCESSDGCLSHNSLSAPFSTDTHLRVQLRHMFNATIPIMASMVKATEKWGDTKASNQTAYNIANGTELPFFGHLKSRPDLQKNFEDYMKSRAVSHTGSRAEYLLQAFDWSVIGSGTVVDVGGSSGSTGIMLATNYPKLRIVVEDLPEPIANARSRIAELPADVQSRVTATEHDFFQPQPIRHAAVYLMRTILHDWPDADAVKIIKGIAEAMSPSSRLLIMDMVLPKPGSGSSIHEAALRQKDLMMLGTFNAKEREEEEWTALIAEANPKLKIQAIRRPAGSELSVIEVALSSEHTNGVVV